MSDKAKPKPDPFMTFCKWFFGIMGIVLIFSIVGGLHQPQTTESKNSNLRYATPHVIPPTFENADYWMRSCVDKEIRKDLANGGIFDWNEPNENRVPPAASILLFMCMPEFGDYLNMCNPQFGADRCKVMSVQLSREEYNAVINGKR